MLSSKIIRPLIGGHGLHHNPHGWLNTTRRRAFTANPKNYGDDDKVSSQEPIADGIGVDCQPSAPSMSNEFNVLDKDVAILKLQVNDIKTALRDLDSKVEKKFDYVAKNFSDLNKKIDSKFDRLPLLIVGGVLLKGGFDIFRDERNYARNIKHS